MNASARYAPNILLLLCSSAAILMTLTGLVFLIGTWVLRIFAHGERFLGEVDAISIALIFGGMGVALKTIEIRVRAEHDSSTDWSGSE
ncbi:hypothetical protein P8935_15250 [Telmatobacter sp. DSM 110680]|uniref:Uncharacterized protein n=1 Tax=Telmatobacter sp. DSM 110680 TaxID=3036704 RepID=A0AAU7DD01_9BACT